MSTNTTQKGFACGIRPVVKLIGSDSNAFNLLGVARKAARQAGVPADEIDAFLKECMDGDFNHLLCAIMDYCDEESFTEDDDDDDDDDEICEECGWSVYNCECDGFLYDEDEN